MTRATLVAVSLAVFAVAGSATAQQPAPALTETPTVAAVNQPQPAPAAEPATAPIAAPEKAPPPPPVTLIAKVDLATQRLTVIERGQTKYTWAISSGTEGFNTPVGNFRPEWMAKMWYSRKYDMSPMPHSVFFRGGAAIHATQHTGSLGRPASHGCVRLAPANAAIFYGLVQRHGLIGTRIHVFGTPKHRAPADAITSRRGPRPAQMAANPYPRVASNVYGHAGNYGSVFLPGPSARIVYQPVRYHAPMHAYRVR